MKSIRLARRVAVIALAFLSAAVHAEEKYAWSSVTIGANGFLNGFVFSPAQDGPLYVATDMGGAYRLDGDTWTCLTDFVAHDDFSLNQMGIESIATDPVNPNRVYVAIGTYMGPSSILISDDAGRTFQREKVPFVMNGNGPARNAGQRMNVDPNQPTKLIYGTRRDGLFESESGRNWRKIESFPTIGDKSKPAKDVGIVWTLFDKASGESGKATPVIYAGVCTEAADKIFVTHDAGQTWTPVANQPGGKLLATRAAITPDGKTLYLTYVTATDWPGPGGVTGGAVWRCENPSTTSPIWTDITPAPESGGGWSGVCLEPNNSNSIYVTTLCRYGKLRDDLYRSRDGGHTWQPLDINSHRDDAGYPYLKDAGIHWTGDIQIDPHHPNVAFFNTGYGAYRTTNLNADKPTWRFFNKGLEQSAVLELISPPSGSAHLLSAIGDRDGYRHDDFSASPKFGRFGQVNDFGQTENLSMGTCDGLDVAWNNPDRVVRVGAGSQYSDDGGISWHLLGGGEARNSFREMRNGPKGPQRGTIAISPDGNTAFWAPKSSVPLVIRRDAKARWGEWENVAGLPSGRTGVAADRVNGGTFYARRDEGLYVSTDNGKTFALASADLPGGEGWLRVDPWHAGHLWATSADAKRGGLYRSTDAGHTWQRVAADAITSAKHVAVGAPSTDKAEPSIFLAGTISGQTGFFRSDDTGQTWLRLNDDAHQYGNVTVIQADPRVVGRIYVGSNGRGILVGDRVK
jgi:photosystem II stability/assembly factor-like uncharacterized protein